MSSLCARCKKPLPSVESDGLTNIEGGSLCEVCRDLTVDTGSEDIDGFETQSLQKPRGSQDRIAQFALVRILGKGSYGNVWLADDLRLGRSVALKLPSGNSPGDSTLLHEAKTAASLRHPNIVAVYEVGIDKGQVFIASELIDGVTLRDFLSIGRPRLERAIEILIPVTEALQYAHEHRVVHRDVKPANILLDNAGKPYVNDFGLAKRLSADETISSQGQVVGTARYMSPEQAFGRTEETDARSDIYSVGVMMFEMMTRESPFRGNARAILQQKVLQDAPSPRMLEPSIPRDLETICLKCLEREPGKRFQHASELSDELRRYVAGEPIQSRPIGRVERGWRWCKRRPAISGLLLALFLALSTGLTGVSYFWRNSVRNAHDTKQKLYRSWMNLAASQTREGNPASVRDLLARTSADPELAAMRGFEFNYFSYLANQVTEVGALGNAVVDVALTEDGTTCAATSGGSEITIWDTTGMQPRRVIQAEQEGFTSIDFSATKRFLAAGSLDGQVWLCDPFEPNPQFRKLSHGPQVRLVTFSPDGQFLIASGLRGAVRMWETESWTLVSQIPTGTAGGDTRAIRFSPDSSRLFIARNDGRIREWSVQRLVETGLNATPVPENEFGTLPDPVAMCVSNSGERLVIAFFRSGLMVRELRDGSEVSAAVIYRKDWGLIQEIQPLPNSPLVAMTASSNKLYLMNIDNGHEVQVVHSHAGTGQLARSGNGDALVVGSGDGSVSRLDVSRLSAPSVVWNDSPVRSAVLLPQSKLIAAADNGDVAAWDLTTGQRVWDDPQDWKPSMLIAFNPKRNLLATGGSRAHIEIRRAALDSEWKFEQVAELKTTPAGVSAMRFSPAGDLLAVAVRRGPVQLFSTDDWVRPRFEIPGNQQIVSSIAVSLDNRTVAIAHSGNAVDLRDGVNGQLTGSIPLEPDVPSALEFCQDGKTLAIGTNAGTLYFYDLDSRRLRFTIRGHTGRINAITLLPSSQTIVSGGQDRHLKLWDLPSGDLVTEFSGHLHQVFAIAAAADGKTIVSGGLDGDLRVWRSELDD